MALDLVCDNDYAAYQRWREQEIDPVMAGRGIGASLKAEEAQKRHEQTHTWQ